MCPSGMTIDELSQVQAEMHTAIDYATYFESALVFLCIFIIFGWYWRLRKPTFVWVMWGLFVTSEVFYLAQISTLRQMSKAWDAGDTEKYDHLKKWFNEFVTARSMTLMSGHWVFAIKYAEVVLNLPLLVFTETIKDIKGKLKRISCAIWTFNGLFAALIFTYTLLMQLYVFGAWKGDN